MKSTEISPVAEALVASGTGLVAAFVLTTLFLRVSSERGQSVASEGGAATIAAFVVAAVMSSSTVGWHGWAAAELMLVAGTVAFGLLGLGERMWSAAPGLRLLAETAVVTPVVAMGVHPGILKPGWLDGAITIAWVIAVAHGYRRLGKPDTLLAIGGMATSGILAWSAFTVGNHALGACMIAFTAACGALLWYTWPPTRMVIGNMARSSLGFALATSTIMVISAPGAAGAPPASKCAWLLLIPFLVYVDSGVAWLLRRRGGPSIARHLSQVLSRLSFTFPQQTLLIGAFVIITTVIGMIALRGAMPAVVVLVSGAAVLFGILAATSMVRLSDGHAPAVDVRTIVPAPGRWTTERARAMPTSGMRRVQNSDRREAADFAKMLIRQWQIIAAGLMIGIASAGTVTAYTIPQYAGSVTLFVSAANAGSADNASAAYHSVLLSKQRVRSYAELARSRATAEQLAGDLGTPENASQLRNRIQAEALSGSVLLRLTVTDPSREEAARIAVTLGTGFARMIENLERSPLTGRSTVRVESVGAPDAPADPISPRPARNLILGLVAGLALGVGIAMLRERLDTSVRTTEVVQDITATPTLGVIHFDKTVPDRPLLTHVEQHSPRSESFRAIRTNTMFVNVDNPVKAILVTSCNAGEGKSVAACNIALSHVEGGARVVVIDGDLRRPRVAEYFGLEGAAGLTNVLVGEASLQDVLQPWGRHGLIVLPSGPIPPNPAELLGSYRMQELLAELTSIADWIIIDAPPLLPVTDAAVLSQMCDGVLLVVRHGKTTQDQLCQAAEQLSAVGARLMGHVLNMAPAKRSTGYGYHQTYVSKQDPANEEIGQLDQLTSRL